MSDWSTLTRDVGAYKSRPGPVCSVKRMLESLTAADRETVEGALSNPALSTTGLAKAFRDRMGVEAPSKFTVGNHRREQCSCSR